MRIFVAGATGAIGRPLVRQLIAAGHTVTGMTRTPEKTGWLLERGARLSLSRLGHRNDEGCGPTS
jgi:nucleoside-diphosphate-sugar epimerase